MKELFNTILMIAIAMLLGGVITRVRSVLSGRKGPSIVQHLHNVALLARKGSVYSPTTSILFRVAPAVYMGSALLALLFIPIGNIDPLLSFRGDVVVFAYLLGLGRLSLVLAAMDTGSSFEGMGASREALYGALVEPALFAVVATLAMVCGYTSFAEIFSVARDLDMQMTIVMVLLAYVLVKVYTVEQGRVPVDDPRTHLELTMIHEVMVLDYSGVDMAMIHCANWFKGAALAVLAANAVMLPLCFKWWTVAPLSLLVAVIVGVVESSQARGKLVRNTTYILTVSALAALLLFVAYLLTLNIQIS
jgi:formate hydrogenlyase subunit 4